MYIKIEKSFRKQKKYGLTHKGSLYFFVGLRVGSALTYRRNQFKKITIYNRNNNS